MKNLTRYLWSVPVGLGLLVFLIAFGSLESGIADPAPEVTIYYSPS